MIRSHKVIVGNTSHGETHFNSIIGADAPPPLLTMIAVLIRKHARSHCSKSGANRFWGMLP